MNNRQFSLQIACKRKDPVISSRTKATSPRAAMVPSSWKVWQMGSADNSSTNASATNFQKTGRPGNSAAVCSVGFRGSPRGSVWSLGSCLSRHGDGITTLDPLQNAKPSVLSEEGRNRVLILSSAASTSLTSVTQSLKSYPLPPSTHTPMTGREGLTNRSRWSTAELKRCVALQDPRARPALCVAPAEVQACRPELRQRWADQIQGSFCTSVAHDAWALKLGPAEVRHFSGDHPLAAPI